MDEPYLNLEEVIKQLVINKGLLNLVRESAHTVFKVQMSFFAACGDARGPPPAVQSK